MTFLKSISTRTQLIKASLLALAAVGFALPEVSPAQLSTQQPSIQASTAVNKSAVSTAAVNTSVEQTILADGNYLFGQSPQPNVNGAAYTVLSVQNSQTVGAFYQPNSSFDCFYGSVQPNQLAINIVDSYEQTVYPYEVALTVDSSVVAGRGAGAYTLEGFHRIDTLSDQDLEILAVCQADFAQ
ncbi:MAG: hypothetical protein AAF635_07735 [Cyanobacteria bacterium P01_C01_bin.69]